MNEEIKAMDLFTPPDVVAPHRTGKLPFQKLNLTGREYTTWLLNPTILLPKLAADSRRRVGGLQAAAVRDEGRRARPAREHRHQLHRLRRKGAVRRSKRHRQRGHLVVLKKTEKKQFYFFSGGCANKVISYAFCRQDDIVIGGTVIPNVDGTERLPADDAVFAKILSNGRELFSGNLKACAL